MHETPATADRASTLRVNLSTVDIIHIQSNNYMYVMDTKIKNTRESKLTDSPGNRIQSCLFVNFERMVKGPTETITSKNRSPCFNCSYTSIESLSL